MSRVLIVGGTGFIGRHLAGALTFAGHAVTTTGRGEFDVVRHQDEALVSRLSNHDIVVNAAGLVRDCGNNTRTAVHVAGTQRLVRACTLAGIQRLIHISALGADPHGPTCYQQTKGRGELALMTITGLECCTLRPSVVIGSGGASTRTLCALAALPVMPRLGPGTWTVQPVSIDDLAQLVVRLVEQEAPLPSRLDVVGPYAITTDQLTASLRRWLGLRPCPFLSIPESLLTIVARYGERLMVGPFDREILLMLKTGNSADPMPYAAILGRMPRDIDTALDACPACDADRQAARLFFVRPLLRWSLGLMWVATGIVSFGLYPVADSLRLLNAIGLDGIRADAALYGGAGLDLVLGLFLLLGIQPKAVGYLMLATMVTFTGLATGLPTEYWLHPFAPLLKNLPIAAAILAMIALEV